MQASPIHARSPLVPCAICGHAIKATDLVITSDDLPVHRRGAGRDPHAIREASAQARNQSSTVQEIARRVVDASRMLRRALQPPK
jgi:hypothetical protein